MRRLPLLCTGREYECASPAERRDFWHRLHRRWQLDDLRSLADDYARDEQEARIENDNHDLMVDYRNSST